ncbi:MAG: glycosyltransferase [Halieaceae bacterium]
MTSPLKVTLLSNFGLPIRGVSPYSSMLLSALKKYRDDFVVTAIDYRSAYPTFASPNPSALDLDSDRKSDVHYASPKSWRKFCTEAEDVVHIQYWTQFGAYYLLYICKYLRKLGKKSILTVHNPVAHETLFLLGRFEKALFRSVDCVIVHTEKGAEILREATANTEPPRVVVIPHGIKLVPAIEDKPQQSYILMFGNIRKYKGTDILLDAWEQIFEDFPDYKLILAGRIWGQGGGMIRRFMNQLLGGSEFSSDILRRLSRANEINIEPRIGFIEEEELDELILSASICVFPYREFSGQSGAASLAAGAGIPIVTSDLPGLSALNIDSTYIVSPLNPASLAKTLAECLKKDGATARSLQREIAENYSWERVAKAHLELYREVASVD